MADVKLDALENQIADLENRIFGKSDKDAVYPKDAPEIIDTLAGIKQQMTTAIGDRQKIEPIMKQLADLNNYLDPSFTEPLTLSKEAKAEIILAEEDYIKQTAENLEKVKDMTEILGSEHIKVVPALETKLQELSKIHLEHQDQSCELSEEVKSLLLQYNSAIALLSKQFVSWDQIVTKLEIDAQPKKKLD